jgi:hypothetical protein
LVPLQATIRDNAEPKRFSGFLHARDRGSWPDRRRRPSNFLTWAFFLAEVSVADLFFGKGAKAADDLGPTSTIEDPPAVAADDLNAWETVGKATELEPAAPDRLLDAGGSLMPMATIEPAAAPGLSAINGIPFAGSSSGGGGGGGSGSGSSAGTDGSSADGAGSMPALSAEGSADLSDLLSELPAGIAVDLGLDLQPLDLTFGLNGSLPPLYLGLDVGTPFLDLSFGGDALSDFDLGAGLAASGMQTAFMQLGDSTGLSLFQGFGSATDFSEIAPLVEGASTSSPSLLVEIGSSDVAPDGHISSDGSIVFATSLPAGTASDGLFSEGRYTDYNLVLQSQTTQSGNDTTAAQNPEDPDALLTGLHDLGHAEGDLSQLSDPALSSDQDLLRGHSI